MHLIECFLCRHKDHLSFYQYGYEKSNSPCQVSGSFGRRTPSPPKKCKVMYCLQYLTTLDGGIFRVVADWLPIAMLQSFLVHPSKLYHLHLTEKFRNIVENVFVRIFCAVHDRINPIFLDGVLPELLFNSS